MLRGDETVSHVHRFLNDQVLSNRIYVETMVQAQDTIIKKTGKIGPGNQSATITLVTPAKKPTRRQGDSSSHGIGRKHGR
jgi:hypothetical protein